LVPWLPGAITLHTNNVVMVADAWAVTALCLECLVSYGDVLLMFCCNHVLILGA
jgi:hypothetical protein